ncbi:MAG: hypothetical protein DI539_27905 [Flavobacterium psychrophilum]|jgi:hypothetical protein|nr:hypothetical protein [Bacteroidota bacterium]MCH5688859.1 hypothetical protein [Niabella sp. W65]MCH7367361.1 hypothetical protein [Niabella sp. W65]PZR02172.1 MAG: hypothetical protein DI539_27905 [Flavobacterium psychrophilum]ULT43021.1 hypothetical protein KRR40_05685 [Niabella sp. I65]
MTTQKEQSNIIIAFLFSLLIPVIGYYYLGALYATIFLIGYLGGFILWISLPSRASWTFLKIPYWLTLFAFLFLHKVEENRMKFFEVVSAKITGGTVPEFSVGLIIGLLVLPIGAWLILPLLLKKKHELGYYAVWTLFASMGISELAHYVFPFMTNEPYGYFPGMLSVVVLAPLAWWGMYRLVKGDHRFGL